MRRILEFLAKEGSFLYEDAGFSIVASEYLPSFGGTGSVTLSDTVIELRLHLDRDRLMLDFRGSSRKSPQEWFSVDVVRQLLTAETDMGFLDAGNVEFLRSRIVELRQRFSQSQLVSTEAALRQLEKQRSKRLFG